MQVEVSKYTEGIVDEALRPNGLPQSLIRYDARQKEEALGSMVEVVQTVKHPHSHIRSVSNNDADVQGTQAKLDSVEVDNMPTPGTQTPQTNAKIGTPNRDFDQSSRKSARVTLKGYKGRSSLKHELQPTLEPEESMTKEIVRVDSWDPEEKNRLSNYVGAH